jgi:glucokinase
MTDRSPNGEPGSLDGRHAALAMELVLGLDVGGTKLRAAIADRAGTVIAELLEPTSGEDAKDLLAQLRDVRDRLRGLADAPVIAVVAAGVALPVSIDPEGRGLTSFHNVPGLDGMDAAAELHGALGMPVAIDNDANLAALAEGRRGAAIGRRDFVVLAIGTGIGMGIVAGGIIVRGAHGAAGDVGFLPIGGDPYGRASRDRGAFELAAAGPALRRRIDRAAAAGGVHFVAGANLEDVARAAEAGDAVARAIIDEEARLVATGIAAVVAVLDPALVVLSGGVGSVTALLEPVRREAAALIVRPPEIRTGLLGDRGPLAGAIELARDLATDGAAHDLPGG